ncbi:MAG: esterase family protein [Oscillospiraceae bacterium]|nr:esterase family protein [Oscillospiraceae bacterium]
MKIRNKSIAAILVMAALLTAGCSEENDVQAETTSLSATSVQTETIAESESVQEETYMEQFKDIITELAPSGYEDKRDGVQYAEFQKHTYFSSTAGRDTNVNVLLPPDYSEDKEYPVLYILHGFYDNEDWMTRSVVNLSTIYGNLLADGKAEEMIIVLPYIFCDKNMPYCTGMDLANCYAYDNFINDLTTDLMPFVEESFSAAKGRENTAITGFSMGGRESLFIGFERPDLFGYIGAVCPAPGLVEIPGSPMHPGQMKAEEMIFADNKPYVVFVSSSDVDGVVGSSPNDYRNIMTENEVEYLSHVMKNTGHDHSSVKPHLYNYLQFLFK